jgi:hypothetical protein
MYGHIRLSVSVKLCSLKYLPITVFNYPNIQAVIVAKHGQSCDNLTRGNAPSTCKWRNEQVWPGCRIVGLISVEYAYNDDVIKRRAIINPHNILFYICVCDSFRYRATCIYACNRNVCFIIVNSIHFRPWPYTYTGNYLSLTNRKDRGQDRPSIHTCHIVSRQCIILSFPLLVGVLIFSVSWGVLKILPPPPTPPWW